MQEPTESDMQDYYDSQRLKGRVIHREGEVCYQKSLEHAIDGMNLTQAMGELVATRNQIVRILENYGF